MYRYLTILLLFSSLSAQDITDKQPNVNSQSTGVWDEYYQNTLNAIEPHKILLLALQYFEIELKAPGLAHGLLIKKI